MTAFPTISALPPAPSRSDPANFNSEAEAFVAALATLRTELNTYRASLISFATEANLPLDWDVDTWEPSFQFATEGDASWSYVTRSGWYRQLGATCHVGFRMTATPTFTTASGQLLLGGFPLNMDHLKQEALSLTLAQTITFPSGFTQIACRPNSATSFRFILLRSDGVGDSVEAADVTSGVQIALTGSGTVTLET